MKKRVVLLCFAFLSVFSQSYNQSKIIFDTDFGGDADDLAALAMLHTMHEKGECELIAIMSWATEEFAVPAMDAINRYYNHPEIPIGIRKNGVYRDPNTYGGPIAERFPYELTAEDAPDATMLYRKLLAEAGNRSITILTVGPLYNIQALLKSGPDEYSKLTGKELVHKKVKEFVIMGGQFPEGKNEWNFNGNMAGVTKYVLNNITLPVTFTGYEIGVKIASAAILNERDHDTPLYIGFKHFSAHASWMKDRYKGIVLDNASYDQTGVLYAVRNGVGTYWTKSENGFCIADDNGGNTWKSDKKGNHTYLQLIMDPNEMADLIEAIMLNEE